MTMEPYYEDKLNLITLYVGDAADIVPSLRRRDLLLTDPPYGLGNAWKRKFHGTNGVTRLWGETPDWDKTPITQSLLDACLNKTDRAVVWGGNFYTLPASRCWFVWDKLQSSRGADCELAWTNLDLAPKVFRMSRIDAYFNKARFKKFHGAEKPVQLMDWCIDHAKPSSILDPFMGAGATVIAAAEAGISVVGIDIAQENCDEVIRRLESAKEQAVNTR